MQPLADIEVARVVDGGFSAQGATFHVVLLDARGLVVHVQRRINALGDDACAKPPRGGVRSFAKYPALKDQLLLIGAADIEVLADDFFEEDAPRHRSVEDLSERALRL